MVEEEEFVDPPRVQLPVLAEQQRGFGEAVRLTGRSTMSGSRQGRLSRTLTAS
jgi:hypothetical protein